MNKEKPEYRIRRIGIDINSAIGQPSADDDMEAERCTHKKRGKLDTDSGDFKEKIKKGRHRRQDY
ncbi:hypothetical protein ACH518_16065 [Methylomonas sp. HW2-6]|uniref:hypothetical protein n=1 Tax=Methylomonas sp. HW2-6 TaxID=3376687 RepID=UPI0040438BBA